MLTKARTYARAHAHKTKHQRIPRNATQKPLGVSKRGRRIGSPSLPLSPRPYKSRGGGRRRSHWRRRDPIGGVVGRHAREREEPPRGAAAADAEEVEGGPPGGGLLLRPLLPRRLLRVRPLPRSGTGGGGVGTAAVGDGGAGGGVGGARGDRRGGGDARVVSVVIKQVLSWRPRALYFPKFATAEQCQSIVKMARANLTPSTLALREGETEEETKGIRTSTGVFIGAAEDPTGLLNQIEEKISRVTMLPKENGEPFNVLRYEVGQKYSSHFDFFDPAEYGPQKSQRVASFLLYLSDVEEGGETMFPYENGLNMDGRYDYDECIGLKVKPQRGDGLLFYSLTTNGTIDPYSLHGSCPVIKGEKWVATKWLRTTKAIEDGR